MGQTGAVSFDQSKADIMEDDISIEASYGTMTTSNSLSVYPRVIKNAQDFVLYFNFKIKEPYLIDVMSSSGELVETIYNSQLSVFNAESSINLSIKTPLDGGMYYIVLTSKDSSQATKLIKF